MKRGRLDARWWAVGGFGDARAASSCILHRRLLVVVVGTRAFSAGGDEGLHDGALRGALGDARRGAPRRGDARFERRAPRRFVREEVQEALGELGAAVERGEVERRPPPGLGRRRPYARVVREQDRGDANGAGRGGPVHGLLPARVARGRVRARGEEGARHLVAVGGGGVVQGTRAGDVRDVRIGAQGEQETHRANVALLGREVERRAAHDVVRRGVHDRGKRDAARYGGVDRRRGEVDVPRPRGLVQAHLREDRGDEGWGAHYK